ADFIKTVEEVISNVSILAKERNITLEFEKPKEYLDPFVFDANKMPLALQNLIDNAIKYTPPGGNVKVSIEKKGKYIEIRVKDSGVGIPNDQRKRLFSKFFRARNVLRMQTAGSGLGLFIVKNIITRHGGKIDVKSKEGEGSTFYFTLPIVEELIPKEELMSEFI
ncbi:MAG TPA: HAMP domain-containing histidine kinase, partial [Ignavibacteria bacterium]|nr:HAMP domain-containing histidine kinase [Ignavibacteria bacterium]